MRSSADDTIVALAAVSTPAAPRDAVTVTDSVSGRGSKTTRMVVSLALSGVTDSANPLARTRKRAFGPRPLVEAEPPIDARFGRSRLPALDLDRYARAGNRRPGRVEHDARNRRVALFGSRGTRREPPDRPSDQQGAAKNLSEAI